MGVQSSNDTVHMEGQLQSGLSLATAGLLVGGLLQRRLAVTAGVNTSKQTANRHIGCSNPWFRTKQQFLRSDPLQAWCLL